MAAITHRSYADTCRWAAAELEGRATNADLKIGVFYLRELADMIDDNLGFADADIRALSDIMAKIKRIVPNNG